MARSIFGLVPGAVVTADADSATILPPWGINGKTIQINVSLKRGYVKEWEAVWKENGEKIYAGFDRTALETFTSIARSLAK